MRIIQTEYKGYRFRSRLEARWAVFLDELDIEWEYEKEGFRLDNGKYYLPDFWVPCPRYHDSSSGYWLEIKGPVPTEDERKKCLYLAKETGHIALLLYGSPTNKFFHKYTYQPLRVNGVVVDAKEHHSKEISPEIEAFLELIGNDPSEQPFFAHFEIATRFWFGQKQHDFDQTKYKNAIKAARGARFEYGEKGA